MDKDVLQPANPVTLLYRDQWLLAVHKPAGLLVHRSLIDAHETEFALQYARAINGAGMCNRLDRPTSGVLMFALDPETVSIAGRALMAGKVRKTYLAMVRGWTPEEGASIISCARIPTTAGVYV